MKLYVVYCWDAYEGEWGHTYFINEAKAREFFEIKHKEDDCWEFGEVETED